ncbi:MAG TPA: hypothetical protein VK797_22680 [Tepidisphaeraceae bacterium]|jgi:hypothetical protein|nr:hypothetical protein [Tepidisphaeraceae bacterium]
MLYREQLDSLPCAHCGEVHPGPRYLHAQCHPQAGVRVVLVMHNQRARIECAQCGRGVAEIGVSFAGATVAVLPQCHRRSPHEARYEDGTLHVVCHVCKSELAKLPVRSIRTRALEET